MLVVIIITTARKFVAIRCYKLMPTHILVLNSLFVSNDGDFLVNLKPLTSGRRLEPSRP